MLLSDVENIEIDSPEYNAAVMAHQVNKLWCELNGDASQKDWYQAPEWQRDSALMGVAFIQTHPEAADSATHDSWMAQKLADGRVYGEVKDPEAKTHPCLVPFEELPQVQQVKDRLFKAVVKAILD